ncbi:MAG: hypothetical protein ACJA2O_004515 [Candidatus Azotimanducaceae bacterium]
MEYFYREKRISDEIQLWETGYWTLTEENAKSLIGRDLYLHSKQLKPSRFGGIIQNIRIVEDGEFKGKVVFEFLADIEHKDVITPSSGWGNEKKIDRN